MLIYEEKKKNYTKPLLIVLFFVACLWGGMKMTQQKASQEHQRGFLEGCLTMAALQFQAHTGHPVPPQVAQRMIEGCLELHWRHNNAIQK